ncbi:MAG: glycosyltransferase family 2 protein [Planctomycetota bacterium]|jgi:GT2 family glycosyltransferase|nr:glycosyltransferase family 2 protein [Planctomycetota bacterium]
MTQPLVSFILVNYRTPDMTINCVRSIRERTAIPHEVVVADSDSGDGSAGKIRVACPGAIVTELDRNLGFGAGCNAAARLAGGKYLYLLNTDTLLHEDSADVLARFLAVRPGVVAVGSRLFYPDGSPQASASKYPSLLGLVAGRDALARMVHPVWPSLGRALASSPPAEWLKEPIRADWCVGASLMVRAGAYRGVGGFDEDFFMYAEETDLCLRLSKLGEIWYTPETAVLHLEGGSGGLEPNPARLARIAAGHRLYFEKHVGRLAARTYMAVWRALSAGKYLFWRGRSLLSRSAGDRKRAEWHRLFVANATALRYPLDDRR